MADASAKLNNLVRSLNLIPYFRNHPTKTPMEAATDLGMTPDELKDALNRLFCTGVGRNTEDMIDLTFSYRDGVTIVNDQGLNKALRLTPTEAGALLLTLESLETMPGLVDSGAVQSAAEKIRSIMDAKTEAIYDSMATVAPEESEVQATIAEAVNQRKKVRFTYWSSGSDTSSERVVDPARIFIYDSEPYLVGWEDAREDHRRYRLDRISDVQVLEETAQPRLRTLDFDPSDPFGFHSARGEEHAQILVRSESTWLARYYDIELGKDNRDGWVEATMPIGSPDWFVRFALGQADRVRVLGPDSLLEAIANRTTAALEGYTQ